MRGIEAVLLLGFIGLVGVGIWNARQWLPLRGTQAAYSAPINAAPPAPLSEKTAAKKIHPRVKRDFDRTVQASATSDQASLTNEGALADPPKPQTTETLVVSVLPTRNDLHPGVTGAQIRSQFGDPTARVTKTTDGHIEEQYYYFNHDRTQVTMATLKGGVIISTESSVR
jgi:hypothetical protein